MLDWNDQQIDTLKALWREGASASEIATALGNGATRSAVLGKINRLKMSDRSPGVNPKKSAAAAKRGRTGNPGQATAAAIRARRSTQSALHSAKRLPAPFAGEPEDGVDVTRLIGIEQLTEHTCKWPVTGDGSKTRFCGEHSVEGKPYCEDHCERAYQAA